MCDADVWSLTVASQRCLDAFDQWCPYISNSEMDSRTGQPPLVKLPVICPCSVKTDATAGIKCYTSLQHSSSRDDSNCLAMLPKLAKLVTTVHCKHLSPASNWRRPRGRPRQTWLPTISDDLIHPNLGLRSAYVVLHGGRSCQQLC